MIRQYWRLIATSEPARWSRGSKGSISLSGPIANLWHLVRYASSAKPNAPISLSNLKPSPGSVKKAKRVGRGFGSGGRLCGRGSKGQNSRSGGGVPPWFEGGQTPFHLTVPKRGFFNPNKKKWTEVNLEQIQHLIDTGRIDGTQPVTIQTLYNAGVKTIRDGVKIMSRHAVHFNTPKLMIQATRFTKEAINRIEQLGGLAVAVHHTRKELRVLCNPAVYRLEPQYTNFRAPPTVKERLYYSQYRFRGYLCPEVVSKVLERDPTFSTRYELAPPLQVPQRPPLPTPKSLKKRLAN